MMGKRILFILSVLSTLGALTYTQHVIMPSGLALGNGTEAAPSLVFENSVSTGLYSVNATDLAVTVNGVLTADFVSNAMSLWDSFQRQAIRFNISDYNITVHNYDGGISAGFGMNRVNTLSGNIGIGWADNGGSVWDLDLSNGSNDLHMFNSNVFSDWYIDTWTGSEQRERFRLFGATGNIRIGNHAQLLARNQAGNGDIAIAQVTTGNEVSIGDANAGNHLNLLVASGGLVRIGGTTNNFPALKHSGGVLQVLHTPLDVLGVSVSGTAGASGTCSSVTVVNGIVTGCTP